MSDQLKLLTDLFKQFAVRNHLVNVPEDFLDLALKAMANLESKAKANVLYELAKCLGTFRPNSTESLLPLSKMPFGLLQYKVVIELSSVIAGCVRMCLCRLYALKIIRSGWSACTYYLEESC